MLILILLLASLSTKAQNFIGNRSDIDQILANISAFSDAVVKADYEVIVDAYTSDAKIFPGKSDIISSPIEIRKYWTLAEGVSTIHHKIIPEEIVIVGKNTAHDYGRYEGKTKRKDGSIVSWKGKYVIVWKKSDHKWKMYLDIWNSIQ